MLRLSNFLIASLFILAPTSFAQLGGFGNAITPDPEAVVSVEPENPGPFEKVTITLKSFDFDVDIATISWYANVRELTTGVGKKSITVETGALGTELKIGIYAKTSDNRIYRETVTIRPEKVLLLSETYDGYTPLFYEGAPLQGEGGRVKVVAYPSYRKNGKKVDPATLSYAWFIDDRKNDRLSGYGKQSAVVRHDELNDRTKVKVIVSDTDGSFAGTETITLFPNEIRPLFYKVDPLFGLQLNEAYTRFVEIRGTSKLAFVPYNYAYERGAVSTFAWLLNGLPVEAEGDMRIALIPKENTQGVSTLQVIYTHKNKVLQDGTANIEVSYNTKR